MRKTLIVLAVLLALLASTAQARPSGYYDCLGVTAGQKISTTAILQGLSLNPDQIRELRVRLLRYDAGRTPLDLTGLGLTAEQTRLIKDRVAAHEKRNAVPVGYPCAPFKNPTRVMSFVRSELVDNGFRPRMTMTLNSPRQIQLVAIQDGIRYFGTVAKYGPRLIKLRLTSTSGGGTYAFTLGFAA